MEDPKSSMGEISSKISSSPDVAGTSWRPAAFAAATRACQASLPRSQSKLSVWRPRRSGTSRGSKILAKETRREAVRFAMASADGAEGVREAAKRGPSLQIERTLHRQAGRDHRRHDTSRTRTYVGEGSGVSEIEGTGQRKALAYPLQGCTSS